MIAVQLNEQECQKFSKVKQKFKKIFYKMDKNGDGVLSKHEFKSAFVEGVANGLDIKDEMVEIVFESLDFNESDEIDYTGKKNLNVEFLSAFSVNSIQESEKYLKEIFRKIDLVKFFNKE